MTIQPRRSKPVISELAKAAGVSATTVSHVFNRPDRVAEATRERVLTLAAEMGYTGADPTARQLRRGRADSVGVVYTDELGFAFDDPAAALIFGGLARVCGAHDQNLLLVPLGPGASGARSSAVASAAVDGFVIYSAAEGTPGLDDVLGRGLPTVIIDQPKNLPKVASVGLDDQGMMRQLTEHLLGLGHVRFGVISSRLGPIRVNGIVDQPRWQGSPYVIIRNRVQGVMEMVTAHGSPEVPVMERFDNSVESGAQALHELLDQHPDLTAVLCLTDVLALGALTAAAQRGLDVPGDLSISGYDDLPEARRAGLTSVGQPLALKGQTAAELLQELQAGRAPRHVTLPTTLEVRRTTGRPRA